MIQAGTILLIVCAPVLWSGEDHFQTLLRRGFEMHREQRYSQSIALLEQARAIQPGDYSVNLLLGMDFLRSGQPRQALSYFEQARKIDSSQPEPLGYEAEAYASIGEFDRTAEILQHMAGRSGEATFALVRFYLRRFAEFTEELRTTTAGLARAYRLQAFVLHQRRDRKERQALLRVQALVPEYPGIASALGQELLLRSEFEEAAAEFSRALERDSNDLDALAGRAVLAVREGRLDEAKRLLTNVDTQAPYRLKIAYSEWPKSVPLSSEVIVTPSNDEAAQLLHMTVPAGDKRASLRYGTELARLERWEQAIPPLEIAARDKSVRLDAAYWLLLCYSRGAERRTEELAAQTKNQEWVSAVRGEVLLRLVHDGSAAAAEFRKAVSLSPSDPALQAGLAEAKLMAGDTAGARACATKALELDPHRFSAMRTFAEAAIQERDYSAAIPVLEKLLANQRDIAAQVLLGTAYAKTGPADRSVRLLETALGQGYPDERGTVHYVLGTAMRQLGRDQEAARLFEHARKLSEAFAQSTGQLSR